MHEQGVNAILADEMVSSESYYVGFLIKDQEYKKAKIAWEKNQHIAMPSLVSAQNLVMYEERLQKFQTDDLLTMCSAHCISSGFFFLINFSKISLFNSFTSLIHFSLAKIYKKLNGETLTLSVILIPSALYLKNSAEYVSCVSAVWQCQATRIWSHTRRSDTLNQWTFQITWIFCSPIFSQFYWPFYSAKEYLEDHGQCLTCCYLHVLYLEAKPSKCKQYRTLLHFWGKMKCNEL